MPGGSDGATMRFSEGNHGANAGLGVARDFLEPVKAQVTKATTFFDIRAPCRGRSLLRSSYSSRKKSGRYCLRPLARYGTGHEY